MKKPDEPSATCPLSHRVAAQASRLIIKLLVAAIVLSMLYVALTQRV